MDYRQYDNALGRFNSVDALSELSEDESPFQFAHNNPVIYSDPTGLIGESLTTKYVDKKGNVLLNTDDGSDDVVVVPDKELKNFKEIVKNTPKEMSDGVEWNEWFKTTYLGFKTTDEYHQYLDGFTTQWSRQNAINYIQNPTFANAAKMFFSEALSQWTDPQRLIGAASALVAAIPYEGEGVIYLRTDKTGVLKPYVGQAKNEARYISRQAEHARANPNADFDFKIINKGSANGNFPTSLDVKEQQALEKIGGPTNKSNPNGGASNKKNVIRR